MKEKAAKLLNIGLPKGSLQDATLALFRKAGFTITVGSRSYIPSIDDDELSGLLIRAQEMARYVQDGILDLGLTGRDWVMEQNARVKEVCTLQYAKGGLRPVRWVVAVPNDSPIRRIEDLRGKRIATELVQFTRRYLKERDIDALGEEPRLLPQLALERVEKALPRSDTAAREEPHLAVVLVMPAEENPAAPAENRRDPQPGCALAHWAEEPNPRSPRPLVASSCTSRTSTVATGAITSCAIRMPGVTTNVSCASVFRRTTRISPR